MSALPPTVDAPPRRQPRRAFRVRWYRTEWTTDADCNPRWTARWFVQEGAAMRLVRRLHASDAVVELDVYGLVHDRSVTWPIAEEDPSA